MVMPLESPLDSVSHPGAAPTHDEFFAWPKARQAELVFEELFIKRTPLSEARRGVVTVLQKLGLEQLLREARAAPLPPGTCVVGDSQGRNLCLPGCTSNAAECEAVVRAPRDTCRFFRANYPQEAAY